MCGSLKICGVRQSVCVWCEEARGVCVVCGSQRSVGCVRQSKKCGAGTRGVVCVRQSPPHHPQPPEAFGVCGR